MDAVAALRAGLLVVLPTDTVYGLAAAAEDETAVRELSRAKGRSGSTPIALVAESVEALLDRVPELRGRDEAIARALLPGPYTLVLRNPAGRYPWLAGDAPDKIGVRVPVLTGESAAVLAEVGAVAATSANLHGGADPRTLADVPEEIRAVAAVLVDGGELPGTASTVIDFTTAEPRVIREGAASSAEAIARVEAVVG
ncbi:MAG TPA: L-threonylcarbamoyladenylate synthase [Gaiellaceae bacterium]|nr:L-threonylcarbamoyladenylate synthase [Gaiellaceae bacterium]